MPTPFLSSEEYDERAHQLYNEGMYDEALDVLREGLTLYPNSVELHIGVGYARLAREEFAWARRSFEESLVLEPEHEDALAGLGETLLRLGQEDAATRCFTRIFELGYADDLDLMLQVGRALFREGSTRERQSLFELSLRFFEEAARQAPEAAEAAACIGYAQHRLGDDTASIASLRRAMQLDSDHAEARIYLANMLYDRAEYEGALYHFEQTRPDDHWDELGIWRLIELKRSVYNLDENDPELAPWQLRVTELTEDMDDVDQMLADLEPGSDGSADGEGEARHQLEMFGTLLSGLADRDSEDRDIAHQVVGGDGENYEGSWEEIVTRMRDAEVERAGSGATLEDFMRERAQHVLVQTGIQLPSHDAESFLRASARAGLLRIVR